MELSNAGADLLGVPESALLRALSRLIQPVSGREAARLGHLPQSTARRALARLAKVGIVHAKEESHAVVYSLNRRHVLWPAAEEILASPAKVERLIADTVINRVGDSATALLFGSLARGGATSESDIDVAIILPEDFGEDEREHLVDELSDRVAIFTGNQVQVLTLTMSDLRRMVETNDPLIASWSDDAHTLVGSQVSELVAMVSR